MSDNSAAFECTRTIPEAMYTLAARIEDVDRAAEWLDSCRESYSVRQPNGPAPRPNRPQFEAYERLKGLPILNIEDRDIFLTGKWSRSDSGNLSCSLQPSAHPGNSGRPGVVRMPNLQGRFDLQPVSPTVTRVTYSLDVDLGGDIPDFVKRPAVQQIPRKSLAGLERMTREGPGMYEQAGRELEAAL